MLVAWLFCFANTIVNLAVTPKLRGGAPVTGPLVSVVIPARDEERAIERTVRALLAQTYRAIEVIVVNDRSTDRTAEILGAIADERLHVVAGSEPPAGWLGKPWAMHQGSRVARGEILLFADADIFYAPEAVASAVDPMEKHGASMAALIPHTEMHGFWENVLMPQLMVVACAFFPIWLANRSTRVRLGAGGGAGNLIRREVYERIGGHEALRGAVIDDVGLARLARRSGKQTIVVRAERFVSVRMYEGLGEIVRGFTKNAFAALDRSYALTLILSVLGIVFHVWPYVAAALGSRISIATVLVITVTRLILFSAMRYNIVAALFAHPLMTLGFTWISLVSAWKTGIRRQLHWRGRTYDAAQTRFGADR